MEFGRNRARRESRDRAMHHDDGSRVSEYQESRAKTAPGAWFCPACTDMYAGRYENGRSGLPRPSEMRYFAPQLRVIRGMSA